MQSALSEGNDSLYLIYSPVPLMLGNCQADEPAALWGMELGEALWSEYLASAHLNSWEVTSAHLDSELLDLREQCLL